MTRRMRVLILSAIVAGGLPAATAGQVPAAAAFVVPPPAAVYPGTPADPDLDAHWRWPVPRPIVVQAPFRAPATPYASGHRGIDLSVESGAIVTAPADGVVAFAGVVVDRGVISIDHGGGVLSSYEPIAGSVVTGQAVNAGDPIGSVAVGGHCADDCLHFGVRVDGGYVSPFRFLGGVPLAVLLPWRDD